MLTDNNCHTKCKKKLMAKLAHLFYGSEIKRAGRMHMDAFTSGEDPLVIVGSDLTSKGLNGSTPTHPITF